MSPSKPRTKSEKEEAGMEIRSREVRKRGRPRRIQSPSVSFDEDEELEEPSRKKKKLNGVGKSRKTSTRETLPRPATPPADEPQEEEEARVEKRVLDAVMQSYRAARALYNQMVDTDGQAAWLVASSRRDSKCSAVTARYREHIPALRLEPIATKGSSDFAIRNAHNNVLQRIKAHLIPDMKGIPPMQFWARIERNIAAEDERTLSHIPFMGDGKEEGFGEELLKTFEEGIHGTSEGCGEFLNDWLAHAVIKQLNEDMQDVSLRNICRAVVHHFPNKLSVNQLLSVWPDLRSRFEDHQDNSVVLPDVDGDAVIVCSAERTLHSYSTLFCRKCFVYDCMLHTGGPMTSPPRKRRRNDSRSVISPCGVDCFRNQLTGTPETRSEQRLSIRIEQGHWSPREETMVNLLRRSFNEDFCRVSRALAIVCPSEPKKTCKQVSAYAKRSGVGPISPTGETLHSPMKKSKRAAKDQHRTFRAVKWTSGGGGSVQNEHVLVACSHPGLCSTESDCPCAAVDNLCTKNCRCGDACRLRFPGCRCAPGGCRTNQCQCYFASWECDADICKSCRCDNFDETTPICRNVNVQRSLQKRLLLAPSDVAGWGCFSQDAIDKNEFISEYCGEVISQEESERRGKIYDRQGCSYLFGLNKEQVVDATRKGNLIRFANHSRRPNCRAKVLMVNGDHRIGIFALKSIAPGDELFFDYSYNNAQQVAFVSKERPPVKTQSRLMVNGNGTGKFGQSAGKCA